MSQHVSIDMELTELHFEDISALQYRLYTCSFGSGTSALVVVFEGEYGTGSGGNGDALFMSAVIKGALAAWHSAGVIIDLRRMTYEFGDAIVAAIDSERVRYPYWPFPTALVVAESNKTGLTSLYREVMGKDPKTFLFSTPEEALQAVQLQYDSLRQSAAQSRPQSTT